MKETETFKMDIDTLLKDLEVDPNLGLRDVDVEKRRNEYGDNALEKKKGETLFAKFFNQFKNFMVIILLVAALVSGLLGEFKDTIIISIVVIINAILGLIQENKAEKSLEALKNMTTPLAKVTRNGTLLQVKSTELVPGDIINLESGDYVPADGRILEESSLRIEESALTGESVAVDKTIEAPVGDRVPLGDRRNMVYSTSMVTHGRGKIVVTNTGMNTEIGKIAKMLEGESKLKTPLQVKLEDLGRYLGILALSVCAVIFLLGYYQGRPLLEMFMLAVSLAVAAIPEGLPAIVTIVLSLGVQRMIKKNAIVKRLPAVETLGTASIICSDKTGTLTENKMTVTKLYTYDEKTEAIGNELNSNESKKLTLEIALLCNDSTITEEKGEKKEIGDPTEIALVVLAYQYGMFKKSMEESKPRVNEIPFDSDRKLMSTIHKEASGLRVYTKGAPDVLLERCNYLLINNEVKELTAEVRDKIRAANQNMANDALRVLAFAYKTIESNPANPTSDTLENDLIFVGLMGMIDPPREEVKMAVKKCRAAGIRPIMITGDYKLTAITIAKKLGILDEKTTAIEGRELDDLSDEELASNVDKYSVYARVSPEHKVRIVKAWQANDKTVAMTGDGVNDAPSLKAANIGCAMGITGTDVSKEAADIVLTDDNFSTIVAAVEEGRNIYENIKKSIHYLLSCNIGEIVALFIALLINIPSPLIPIHILWINLVTDSLPALSLGVDPPEADIMSKKPRISGESIFAEGLGIFIVLRGIIIGLVALLAFYSGWSNSVEIGRTMAFLTLAFSQFANSLSVRSLDKSLLKIGVFSNKRLIGAIVISASLMFSVLLIPFFRSAFELALLNFNQWLLVFIYSLIPFVFGELLKKLLKSKTVKAI
ncbi:calcium-translocating P-type ATPase, SERCA-type [Alkaliphilus pronyensis]|uniref:P-type Ca(2+) transporter n=1 Tax=Alkaliphilus pronyensis TaxID=1482732 RepID=A0A6I0F593_9FIRM|nr:calcium-translocating P-type ATPase, SERCA-type [Alkaliphilus pronyensis]KAB3530483.1 calcium-translocating P-type ATPase, SERCA-type [Alkaliphilus pronyensis]